MLRRRTRSPLASAAVFHRYARPCSRFSQRVSVHLFVCGRSFSILGESGDHCVILGRCGVVVEARGGLAADDPDKLGCVALLVVLGVLSCRHESRMYTDIEVLYRTTIDRNPACWMAHYNLGHFLAQQRRFDDAIARYQEALKIKPDYFEAEDNLRDGGLVDLRQVHEAIAHYRKAPGNQARFCSGSQQPWRRRPDGYRTGTTRLSLISGEAVEIKLDFFEAHNNLSVGIGPPRTGRRSHCPLPKSPRNQPRLSGHSQ